MLAGILWLIMRLVTSLFALVFAELQTMPSDVAYGPLWPVQGAWPAWLERVFLIPLQHWDVAWYVQIVTHGYQANDGTAIFHPLYPVLAAGLSVFGLNPLLSLFVVGSAAGIAGTYWFQKLAALDFSIEEARTSLILFFFWPVSFVLFIPYTEALFLLCSILCVYTARQKKWWLSGLLGALAVLTRQQGILLVIPLAWELWEASGKNFRQALNRMVDWCALGLIPLGNLSWIFYRSMILNDSIGTVKSPADFIYHVLISPSVVHVTEFEFMFPWQAVWIAFVKLVNNPDVDIWTNLVLAGFFLLLFVFTWPHLRMSYRLYSLAVLLLSFSFQTGSIHPYMGLVRHLWLAFPVFMGLGRALAAPWQRLLYVSIGLCGVIFLICVFTFEAWVP